MIDMSKKYRTRDGRDVRILCIDGPQPVYPICGLVGLSFYTWTTEGKKRHVDHQPSSDDLIEVVPDVVWWRRQFLGEVHDSWSQKFDSLADLKRREVSCDATVLAILKFTIRNAGKSHTDVTVEVLPVDHQESTP